MSQELEMENLLKKMANKFKKKKAMDPSSYKGYFDKDKDKKGGSTITTNVTDDPFLEEEGGDGGGDAGGSDPGQGGGGSYGSSNSVTYDGDDAGFWAGKQTDKRNKKNRSGWLSLGGNKYIAEMFDNYEEQKTAAFFEELGLKELYEEYKQESLKESQKVKEYNDFLKILSEGGLSKTGDQDDWLQEQEEFSQDPNNYVDAAVQHLIKRGAPQMALKRMQEFFHEGHWEGVVMILKNILGSSKAEGYQGLFPILNYAAQRAKSDIKPDQFKGDRSFKSVDPHSQETVEEKLSQDQVDKIADRLYFLIGEVERASATDAELHRKSPVSSLGHSPSGFDYEAVGREIEHLKSLLRPKEG